MKSARAGRSEIRLELGWRGRENAACVVIKVMPRRRDSLTTQALKSILYIEAINAQRKPSSICAISMRRNAWRRPLRYQALGLLYSIQ